MLEHSYAEESLIFTWEGGTDSISTMNVIEWLRNMEKSKEQVPLWYEIVVLSRCGKESWQREQSPKGDSGAQKWLLAGHKKKHQYITGRWRRQNTENMESAMNLWQALFTNMYKYSWELLEKLNIWLFYKKSGNLALASPEKKSTNYRLGKVYRQSVPWQWEFSSMSRTIFNFELKI